MNEIKLHLGCGKRFLEGYVHIDLSEYSHINYNHNITTLPMCKTGSVNLIYASHVLEYFDREEVIDVLNEWYRVLKPKGIIRLAVPDFDALLSVYTTHSLDNILGPLYGRWEVAPGKFIYHKTVYNFDQLSNLLKSTGFKKPKLWNWREVFVDELEGFDDFSQAYIPHMDKDNGKLISLNVEAIK
jgi:predicted SAM-dependent methyltransferase